MEENENQQYIQNNEPNNIENNKQDSYQQNQSNNSNEYQQQENSNNQNKIQEQNNIDNNYQNKNQIIQESVQQKDQHNNPGINQQQNIQTTPQHSTNNNKHINVQTQTEEHQQQQQGNNVEIDLRRQEEERIVDIIKLKIKNIREKYDFSIRFCDIVQKIIKCFHEQTYTKLSNSINESLNFITFFKDSVDLYAKFSKQIQETNNLIMTSQNQEKLNDNLLSDVMQKTQNTLLERFTKISNTLKQNIINKGPLGNIQEKINKIENIKKENYEKMKNILESKKNLQKNMSKYDKLFESYLPKPNVINNNIQERPSLIDTPDFIIVVKTMLNFINKLILDINLFIIDTKDTLYKINGLFVEINNLVKDAVLIYIEECKSIFNVDLTKNFEEIEKYYKKLDEKSDDQMFKLTKIFSNNENEAMVNILLEQYYIILGESKSVKKELLADKNKFSIKNESDVFLFFEWFISVSPQPVDIPVHDLLVKQISIKRDPGIFSKWRDSILIFTKQQHLLLFDKPGYLDDLVKIFELDKTSFRKRTDKKNQFLFELIVSRKGLVMDFKDTYLCDALNQENIDEIPNLVYSAYNA